jgi:hypothetical protein
MNKFKDPLRQKFQTSVNKDNYKNISCNIIGKHFPDMAITALTSAKLTGNFIFGNILYKAFHCYDNSQKS